MALKVAIVGLPNVGKSTLFNALTQTAAAQAANYPFCTIEPNVGEVAVPEPRLEALARIAKSKEIIPARITFVDVAGLVRGAASGEGLGNQFLANIRDCDATALVARCFADGDVTHVEGRIDPLADRAGRPAPRASSARLARRRVAALSLSPPLARFSSAGIRRSRLSRSASISSVSMISRSASGSMRPSTWVTSPSAKQRATRAVASQSRMLARN